MWVEVGSGVEVGGSGVFVGGVVASAIAGSGVNVGIGSGAGVPPQAVMATAVAKVMQRVMMVRSITKPPHGSGSASVPGSFTHNDQSGAR